MEARDGQMTGDDDGAGAAIPPTPPTPAAPAEGGIAKDVADSEGGVEEVGQRLAGMEVEEDEDPEMELGEDDIEEVVFEDDKPPSDDEDGDDEGEEMEEHAEGDGPQLAPPGEPDCTVTTFAAHGEPVYCASLSSDGSRALSGGGDDNGYVWDVSTGAVIFKLGGHTDSIVDCGFSFDDKLLATAAYDSTVKIWDAGTGALLQSLDGPSSEIEWLCWHPKGNVVMAGSEDATCWVWDAATGNCLSVLAGHEAPLTCGAFTPNGKRIVTGSLDGTVRLWDPKTSTCAHSFSGHDWHQAGVVSLRCHPDQPMVAAGGQDGTVRLARLESKKVVASFMHDQTQAGAVGAAAATTTAGAQQGGEPSSVEAVDFCLVAPFIATGGTDGTLKVFDINTQSCRQVCRHADTVTNVEFLPQSTLMVSASSDGTARLWDSRSGDSVKLLTRHSDMVLGLAVRAGVVVTSSDDQTCRVARL